MEQVEILTTPIKSERDKKEYRLIKLGNGFRALLISMEENAAENHAAASLLVSVGSFHDPPSIGGLAHLLEHLIFIGSEKYPDERGFASFISTNGGRYNAYTTSDYTSYNFRIFEDAFEEALDRFADMLKHPLITVSTIQKEREVLDSEFQMASSSSKIRQLAILKSMFRETQRAAKFEYGNLKTLKENISDDDLQKQLFEFFQKYRANKMILCVQSKKSLDEMQLMVVEKFFSVKNDENEEIVETDDFDIDTFVKPEFFNNLIYIKPLTPTKKIILTWILPQQISNDDCKPLKYLYEVFNNEDDKGLASWLKKNNLATEFHMETINEGDFNFNRQFSLVQLTTELTNHGMAYLDDILSAIFSYLLLLKETSIEEHKRLFEQFRRKHFINFKFYQEISADENVKKLGEKLLYSNNVNILQASSAVEFNENAVINVVNQLNEFRFNVIIEDDKRENYYKRERYFGVEYDEVNFPETYISLWKNRKLNENLSLPEENPFEPSNFDIKIKTEESTIFPKKIFEDATFEVWHKLDDNFKLPKAIVKVQFIIAKHLDEINNFLLFDIYKSMSDLHIRKKLSQAFYSDFDVVMTTSRFGIEFEFAGYNDKLELFIDMFFREFTNVFEIVTETSFQRFKEKEKKKLLSYMSYVSIINNDYLKKLLSDKFYTCYDLYKEFDNLSFEDVQKIIPMVFEKLKIKVLSQGNITKEETMNIVKIFEWSFDNEAHTEELEIHARAYQLPISTNNVLRITSSLLPNDSSEITSYYQIGRMTIQGINFGRIFEIYVRPKAFDFLRNQNHLGYSVLAQLEILNGTLGFSITVSSQESKHKFTEVSEKIDEFVDKILPDISKMTNDEFEKLKSTRIKNILAKDTSLKVETLRNWHMISQEYYMFNKQEVNANVTIKLTRDELIYFVNSFLQPVNRRTVSLQVIGSMKNKRSDEKQNLIEFMIEKHRDGESLITDIESFQKDLYLYPPLKVFE